MGFSISWCAVPEKHAAGFMQAMGLTATSETEEYPESLITTAKLDTGWQLLIYNNYQCPFLQEADLRRISVDYDVLFCRVEEHVMASSSEMWSGGTRKWWLFHEGEDGPKGLSGDGEPPEPYPAIRRDMEREQATAGGDAAGVDYIFEIPLKVAQSLVGFKHDEICPHVVDKQYVVLARSVTSGGFLRRLLRK